MPKKGAYALVVLLLSIGIAVSAFNVHPARAQTPRIFASPATFTAYPTCRYNFSIMAENMAQCATVAVSVKSSNMTVAKIVHFYSGAICQPPYNWSWLYGAWFPETGDVWDLCAYTFEGEDITTAVECFKIEVECYNLTPSSGIIIDIYQQYAYDVDGGSLVPDASDCPYDHTVRIMPSSVGGIQVRVNKIELMAPTTGLVSLAAIVTASTAYLRHRKRKHD